MLVDDGQGGSAYLPAVGNPAAARQPFDLAPPVATPLPYNVMQWAPPPPPPPTADPSPSAPSLPEPIAASAPITTCTASPTTTSAAEPPAPTKPRSKRGRKPLPFPRVHRCLDCNVTFKRSHGLHRHRRTAHTDVRPFVCVGCGRAFKRKDSMAKHSAGACGGREVEEEGEGEEVGEGEEGGEGLDEVE
ncbi:hypothetical protein HDU96_008818, partial [Phlyctochytrium bullatum]